MDGHVCGLDALNIDTIYLMEEEHLVEIVYDYYQVVYDEPLPRLQNVSRCELVEMVRKMVVQSREVIKQSDL